MPSIAQQDRFRLNPFGHEQSRSAPNDRIDQQEILDDIAQRPEMVLPDPEAEESMSREEMFSLLTDPSPMEEEMENFEHLCESMEGEMRCVENQHEHGK